jgi:hypothetical protein
MVKYMNKEITMPYTVNGQPATKEEFDAVYNSAKSRTGDILGEPGIYQKNGYTGVNLDSGATVVYRDVRRRKHGGSGAGSAEFAAQDPRRLDIEQPARDTGNATPGAEPPEETPAEVQNYQADATQTTAAPVQDETDLRAILKVPPIYITKPFDKVFSQYGGVLFPITPQITLESKADYSSITPLHSNYPINFYKSSSVSDITVTAPFTVQNDDDAYYYLGMVRILSALTKMRFGNEAMAGSPPPICRLFAYGEYVLKNVPVVVTSVRHDLPDDVDFYTSSVLLDGRVSVPTKATFTVNLKPTYSRAEMMKASVSSYLTNSMPGKGYL